MADETEEWQLSPLKAVVCGGVVVKQIGVLWYGSWRPHMALDGFRPDDFYCLDRIAGGRATSSDPSVSSRPHTALTSTQRRVRRRDQARRIDSSELWG